MKLQRFQIVNGYRFHLLFENGMDVTVDLYDLLHDKVSLEAVQSARIDKDWGCLEFMEGRVDIEPKTLYRYASQRYDEAS